MCAPHHLCPHPFLELPWYGRPAAEVDDVHPVRPVLSAASTVRVPAHDALAQIGVSLQLGHAGGAFTARHVHDLGTLATGDHRSQVDVKPAAALHQQRGGLPVRLRQAVGAILLGRRSLEADGKDGGEAPPRSAVHGSSTAVSAQCFLLFQNAAHPVGFVADPGTKRAASSLTEVRSLAVKSSAVRATGRVHCIAYARTLHTRTAIWHHYGRACGLVQGPADSRITRSTPQTPAERWRRSVPRRPTPWSATRQTSGTVPPCVEPGAGCCPVSVPSPSH